MCGLPGGYPDDLIDVDLDALRDRGGRAVAATASSGSRNADYLARPLRLTATEASAMIVALRALRDATQTATREVVDRVLGKLEAAAGQCRRGRPDRSRHRGPPSRRRRARRPAAARLRGASGRCGSSTTSRRATSSSERVVDPRGVVTSGGIAYLDAWCHSAEAPRLFRLDRIAAAGCSTPGS